MNKFYIYIYLDPRKSGRYCYNDVCFIFEPIYIGKGKDNRYKELDNSRCRLFKNKINKIKQSGLEPIVFKLYENLNEENSFKFEKQLINEIGRINLKTGSLVNITDGGDGISGYIFSDESKKKMSCDRKGRPKSEEHKKKLSENHADFRGEKHPKSMLGKHHSEESKNKISEKKKGFSLSEEHKKKLSENHADFRGEKHPNSKLTEQKVIQIKLLLKDGILTQQEIADMFGVSRRTISYIKIGRSWSHVG